MVDNNGGKLNNIWASQNARLGSFLLASAFLVTAFISLGTKVDDTSIFFKHTLAGLGSVLAYIYFLMNLWLAMPNWVPQCMRNERRSNEQVIHTYVVPLLFLIFWILVWMEVNDYWSICVGVILIVILLLFFIVFIKFQKQRDKSKLTSLVGDDVISRINATVQADLEEADKCLSYGVPTASVMIGLRVVEKTLRQVYKNLTGKESRKMWRQLLDDIQAHLKNKGIDKSPLFNYLDYVRGIRNQNDYPDHAFTQLEAKQLFRHVIDIIKEADTLGGTTNTT